MSRNMLGGPRGDLFGIVQDFVNKLQAGAITPMEAKRFLRKENPWPDVFPVTINYDQTIEEMVAAGQYNWSSPSISSEHFPSSQRGKSRVEIHLVQFDETVNEEDVLQYFDKRGWRAATAAELLPIGEQNPDLQRRYPVVALGSVWRGERGDRYYAYLISDDDGRKVDGGWFGLRWLSRTCFAAVRK